MWYMIRWSKNKITSMVKRLLQTYWTREKDLRERLNWNITNWYSSPQITILYEYMRLYKKKYYEYENFQ